MSFDPSANQFNSPHYLGWIGIFIRFPHTCSLWHKGSESFLCHNNKAGLDSIHQGAKLWFLLCRRNSEYSIDPKSRCPGRATPNDPHGILVHEGKETWLTESTCIASTSLILFWWEGRWSENQPYLWFMIFLFARYGTNTLGKAALWSVLQIHYL